MSFNKVFLSNILLHDEYLQLLRKCSTTYSKEKQRVKYKTLIRKHKLVRLEKYLSAYTTALKKTNFVLAYIDAFAGTGTIETKDTKNVDASQGFFFGNEEEIDLKEFIDGSAKIALQIENKFHKYIFIEKHRKRCEKLE